MPENKCQGENAAEVQALKEARCAWNMKMQVMKGPTVRDKALGV